MQGVPQNPVLVTDIVHVNDEKQPNMVVPQWRKHFTVAEWKSIGEDSRETFLLKLTLSEMIQDLTNCLMKNVDWTETESTRQHASPR